MSRKNRRSNRKASRKSSRKDSRKNYRKASRKNYRKASRKSSRRNNMNTFDFMSGGKYDPMEISLKQGGEYLDIHKNQHGGAALSGAPVDYEMRLDPALVPSSRTGPLDAALQEIQGMSDFAPSAQTGGRRKHRKASKKSKKASRKASKKSRKASKKSKKSRKTRKSRKMRGGALAGAPYNSPSMLLSASQGAKAGTADFSNPLLLK
jgi:hypothetical protein